MIFLGLGSLYRDTSWEWDPNRLSISVVELSKNLKNFCAHHNDTGGEEVIPDFWSLRMSTVACACPMCGQPERIPGPPPRARYTNQNRGSPRVALERGQRVVEINSVVETKGGV